MANNTEGLSAKVSGPLAFGVPGGYYTPVAKQLDDSTLEFTFTPSLKGMPVVQPVQVTLPFGKNADLTGYAKQEELPKKTSDLENDSGFLTDYTETDPTVPSWAKQPEKPSYTAQEVGADPAGTAENKVSQHNTDAAAHNDLRIELKALADRINAVLDSDDETLDELSEIVAYIKSNKTLIDAITASKVSVTDIVDDLVTNLADKPLSAAQGVALKGLIDAIVIPVLSVNGKIGTVNLSASDVGALPSTYVPPDQTAEQVGADPAGTAVAAVSSHNTDTDAHNDLRMLIDGLATRLNTVANSDDVNLDQLSELVAYIKNNKSLIDGITTSKVNVSDIVDNLVTNVMNKPLSAAQGVVLKGLIDALSTGKLDASKLTEAVNTALAQAKESGEFDGASGDDGGYYTPEVTQLDSKTMTIAFTGSKNDMPGVGSKNVTLPAGPSGYSPVRGEDYWTNEDKAEIKAYVDEAILGGVW